jgi:hypothetical protein
MADTVLINGISYSASNVNVVMYGVAQSGITSITYKAAQVKENNYGLGVAPISRGYGNKTYECTIEMYRESWMSIVNAAPNKDPLSIPPSQFQVIFSGDSVLFNQDNLEAAECMEDPLTVASGDTSIKVTIPFIIAGITHV